MKQISEFNNEYRFLSNFWLCDIEFQGHIFPSVEHAYVFSNTLVPEEQELFLKECMSLTPGQIKRFGRNLTLRSDWDEVKVDLMRFFVYQKFMKHTELREKLIATGDAELIEGNQWGDIFWGVCKGNGQNWLGKLLMEIRTALRV